MSDLFAKIPLEHEKIEDESRFNGIYKLKDLTNEICDNGYCDIDSDFFSSKVDDIPYDEFSDDWDSTEEYEEEYEDYDEDEDDDGGSFDHVPFTPILPRVNNLIQFSYASSSMSKNRFNVVIHGIENINPNTLSNCISECSFDNDSVNVKMYPDPETYHRLCETMYGVYDCLDCRSGYSKAKGGDIEIQILDPTGVIVMKHKFYGTVISSVNEDSFSYDSNDLHEVNVTFYYDHHCVED